jgi:hypothetical protein
MMHRHLGEDNQNQFLPYLALALVYTGLNVFVGAYAVANRRARHRRPPPGSDG